MEPKCIVVSGPSGVGKSVLVNAAVKWAEEGLPGRLKLSVSHTTRPPRDGERDGVHYYFVDPERFSAMDSAGDFLEQTSIYGNRYGTSRRYVERELARGKHVLLELDSAGARQVREIFPQCSYTIFVMPPCEDALQKRLRARAQDTPEEICRRLAEAKAEMRQAEHFHKQLVNDDLGQARDELIRTLQGLLDEGG